MKKKFTAVIQTVVVETHDVKTFCLARPEELSFVPGQYALLSMPDREKFAGEKRPFTFSSSPTERQVVNFTVKNMGNFTQELFSHQPGESFEFKGPRGEMLNFDDSVNQDVVFMAGGSGITPFISAIRYAIVRDLPNQLTLLYGNRTRSDIIYHQELSAITQANIRVVDILATPESDWDGETGYIDIERVQKYVSEPQQKLWYICGPPPMVRAMQSLLDRLEISAANRRLEPWELPGKHDSASPSPQ